jgi:hypothetical protein
VVLPAMDSHQIKSLPAEAGSVLTEFAN